MAARHFAGQRERGTYPPYLFPSVCFTCRKSFKRPPTKNAIVCPQCRGGLIQLSRKFSTPKSRDIEQWRKVEALVQAGFYFQSLYEMDANGKRNNRVMYPVRLREVQAFVARYSYILNGPRTKRPQHTIALPLQRKSCIHWAGASDA